MEILRQSQHKQTNYMGKIIFSLCSLGVAGATLFLYTQPTYDNVKVLENQSSEYSQALAKARELQELIKSLLDRYNSFEPGDLDRLNRSLPDHVDNVRLVLDLDNLASKHRMSLENVAIGQAAKNSSQSASVGAAQPIGKNDQKYDSLTLSFTMHGTYEDFTAFLKDIESSLRIVDVVSLGIVPDSSQAVGQYQYDMMIRTYWLK